MHTHTCRLVRVVIEVVYFITQTRVKAYKLKEKAKDVYEYMSGN